jgi:U2 small nuclear ribonucleoprotein B''
MGDPKQTLYLQNLNDKVSKSEMSEALYLLCSRYGPVLEVVIMNTKKLRGQAFVVFKDLATATAARRELHEKVIFGKSMRVFYAVRPSFLIEPGERRLRDAKAAKEKERAAEANRKRQRE